MTCRTCLLVALLLSSSGCSSDGAQSPLTGPGQAGAQARCEPCVKDSDCAPKLACSTSMGAFRTSPKHWTCKSLEDLDYAYAGLPVCDADCPVLGYPPGSVVVSGQCQCPASAGPHCGECPNPYMAAPDCTSCKQAYTGVNCGKYAFTAVAAGDKHACGLQPNGRILCWGLNMVAPLLSPSGRRHSEGPLRFVDIAAGGWSTCGLKSDARALCSGTLVAPAEARFKAITVGQQHACGLRDNGTVSCWGNNSEGQATPLKGETFSVVAAGLAHTCGVTTDGAAHCWGSDYHGQSTPPSGQVFVGIAAGSHRTCGLRKDGKAFCWGQNFGGVQGVVVEGPNGQPFTAIAVNYSVTVGLLGSGEAWGTQVGLQSPDEGESYTDLSAGNGYVCLLQSDGEVRCLGKNDAGQITLPLP